MNPPIPEISAPQLPVTRGPRPRWLSALLVVDAVLFVVQAFTIHNDPSYRDPELSQSTNLFLNWGAFLFMVALWALVAFFLWQGRNWARIIMIVFCVTSLLSLPFSPPTQYTLSNILSVVTALFALVWLWFLTRRETAAWCKDTLVS
ncbi:MAG TPA: hypothetical protein VF681_06690 [Abditibacteriaceae bacterium]|jgi:hypothetical protein